ncbi:MAG: SpoIIE family protein phosphatase [Acidobacteria bacterium]|nr:SpoIIE family protein phosphatase [Acidobacteriota bacterium]
MSAGRTRLVSAVTLGLAMALPHPASAGELPLRFERLSLEQGLSQSIVECILQDARGFMWFGTEDGLNRYDGYQFVVFRPSPVRAGGISTAHVTTLTQDRAGILWIGTFNGGLNRYDPRTGEFQAYRNRPGDPLSLGHDLVRAIREDRQGQLWIATGGGLSRFDPARGTFTNYAHDPAAPESLPASVVDSLLIDRQGIVWAGTRGGGLARLDPREGAFRSFRHDPARAESLAHDDVTALLEDRQGRLWVGTRGGGLDLLDRDSWAFRHFRHDPTRPASLGHDHVTALAQDRAGRIWIGTNGGGLQLYAPETEDFMRYQTDPAEPGSLSRNEVRAILEDAGGMLWVGTYGGGLNRADPGRKPFRTYRARPGDPDSVGNEIVWTFLEAADGSVWVGSHGGGLERLDPATGRWTHFRSRPRDPQSLSDDRVRVICPSRTGHHWIGTDGGGLDRFDPRGGTFVAYRHDPADPGSLAHDQIRALLEDRDGTLWVGTFGGGLDRLDPGARTFVHYRHDEANPQSLGNDVVRALLQDRQGRIWVATHGGGLNLLDRERGTFRRFLPVAERPSLSSPFIFSLYEDSRGTFWVGTWGGGLNRFDPQDGSAEVLTTADGLPSNNIYGILEDDAGRLWMSTNAGLSRFDPERRSFHNYSESDGLQSNEFNGNAFHRGPSGRMYFGGIKGFTTFLPGAILDNPHPPPVVITRFLKLNREAGTPLAIPETRQVEVGPADYFIAFEFAALDFAAPARNRYAYRMLGLDPDWITVSADRRFATYTNLQPGSYTLQVRASNNDGVWNDEGAALAVVVQPPYYATWWFRVLMAGLASGAVLLGTRAWLARHEERARLRLLESELDVAAHIQCSLLPSEFPPFPGRTDVDVFAQMVPARHVGGDFYDFYLVGPDRLAFAVGDVSGKGVPAALQMSLCRVLVKGAAIAGRPVGQVAAVVNGTLVGELPANGFITAFLGILELSSGRLEYVLAGHNPPAVIGTDGRVRFLDAPACMFLGKFPEAHYETGTAQLAPGETLVLYTDGITEALDANGKCFDEEPGRLGRLLAATAGMSLAEAAAALMRSVEAHSAGVPQSDDRTLMLIRRPGPAARA